MAYSDLRRTVRVKTGKYSNDKSRVILLAIEPDVTGSDVLERYKRATFDQYRNTIRVSQQALIAAPASMYIKLMGHPMGATSGYDWRPSVIASVHDKTIFGDHITGDLLSCGNHPIPALRAVTHSTVFHDRFSARVINTSAHPIPAATFLADDILAAVRQT